MNLCHRFPNLYLISNLSLLGLVVLNSSTLAAAEISERAVHSEVLVTDTGLPKEISPTSSNVENAIAQTTLEDIPQEPTLTLEEQVTSVNQLTDVQPTDWAFEALRSLIERYGVIAGYPNGTFRGNRAMSRYEFAAALNAALERINELMATGTAERVSREDLATVAVLMFLEPISKWHFHPSLLFLVVTDWGITMILPLVMLNPTTGWRVLHFETF
jgi:hypothetical protein